MNLNKMLAALMVATMSLTLAPMATADDPDPLNCTVEEASRADLAKDGNGDFSSPTAELSPSNHFDVFRLTPSDIATGAQYEVTLTAENADTTLTLYKVESESGACLILGVLDGDGPVSSLNFVGVMGDDYRIKVERHAAATPAWDDDYAFIVDKQ